MNDYQDIQLVCTCGEQFVWTVGEQAFLDDLFERGKIEKVNQPKRCPACRAKKKQENYDRENSGR